MDDKAVIQFVELAKQRNFNVESLRSALTRGGASEQQIAGALQYFQGGSAPAIRMPVTNPGAPTPAAPAAPAPAPAPAATPAPAPTPAPAALSVPGKFGGPMPTTKNAAAARLKAVSYLNGTAPPKLSGRGVTTATLNAATQKIEAALKAAGRLPEGTDVPKFTGKTPPKALIDLKGSLPGGLGAGPAGAAPAAAPAPAPAPAAAPAPASAPAPKGTPAPKGAPVPKATGPGFTNPLRNTNIPQAVSPPTAAGPKIFGGRVSAPLPGFTVQDPINPAISYGTTPPKTLTPVPSSGASTLPAGRVGAPVGARVPNPANLMPVDPSKLPVPAGSVPKGPAASFADDAGKIAARAGRFRGLGSSLGFGALGLGFMFMDARAQQRARQQELQNFAMQTTMGTQQRADRNVALQQAVGETDRLQAMAALSEAGATMDPREMELAALLGQTGAVAAQRAAVAPQLDEVALDHVLRMT